MLPGPGLPVRAGTWQEAAKGVNPALSCPHSDSKELTLAWPHKLHKAGPVPSSERRERSFLSVGCQALETTPSPTEGAEVVPISPGGFGSRPVPEGSVGKDRQGGAKKNFMGRG